MSFFDYLEARELIADFLVKFPALTKLQPQHPSTAPHRQILLS
jgi:hypothetical protein